MCLWTTILLNNHIIFLWYWIENRLSYPNLAPSIYYGSVIWNVKSFSFIWFIGAISIYDVCKSRFFMLHNVEVELNILLVLWSPSEGLFHRTIHFKSMHNYSCNFSFDHCKFGSLLYCLLLFSAKNRTISNLSWNVNNYHVEQFRMSFAECQQN